MTAGAFVSERLFTVDEYYRMLNAGILNEDDRIELIDGRIVNMSPIGPRHAHSVNQLNMLLTRVLGESFVVAIQNPIHLDDQSEPQPDVAILRPRPYEGHATPGDVLLV